MIEIVQPAPRESGDGKRLPLSYINFYLASGVVIMPVFNDPEDAPAYQTIRTVVLDREVVQIPALNILQAGGGIHCITQQQPV